MLRIAHKPAVLFCSVLVLAPIVPAEEITLQKALSVVQGPSAEQLDVKIAAARLRVLESLSKRHFDLRPQLGVLTLTNPIVMAASIGSGLLVNRNSAPSRSSVLEARAELLLAELLYSQSSFNKRLQTSRAFFDLIDAQRDEKQSCDEKQAHDRARSAVKLLVARGRLTMVDQLRYEQQAVHLISECFDSHLRRKVAAASLGAALGVQHADIVAALDNAGTDSPRKTGTGPEADSDSLFNPSVPENLRRKATEIRRIAAQGGRMKMPDMSMFQSSLKEAGDLGNVSPDYLAGGNYLYPTLSWKISLRDTGEHKAEAELLNAKLEKLEAGIDAYEQSLRTEIQTLEAMNEASPQRVEMEEQKLAIAARSREMIGVRYQKGLALITDVFEAEQQERRLRANVDRIRGEASARHLITSILLGGAPAAIVARSELPVVSASLQRVAAQQTNLDPRIPLARSTQQVPVGQMETPAATERNRSNETGPTPARVSRPVIQASSNQVRTLFRNTGSSRALVCGVVNGRVANCVAAPAPTSEVNR